jgi:hypothetical protein
MNKMYRELEGNITIEIKKKRSFESTVFSGAQNALG